MDEHIQLSAGTVIDNSVCKFTAHQIEFLRDIASKDGFNGLLAPDFNQSRASGPFVCTWLEGTKRRNAYVGRYRTMPHHMQPFQFAHLRYAQMPNWRRELVLANGKFTFPDIDNNDDEAVMGHLYNEFDKLRVAIDDGQPYGPTKAAFHFAAQMVIFGNRAFAIEKQAEIDKMCEVEREPV